jgi:hypothetical protein
MMQKQKTGYLDKEINQEKETWGALKNAGQEVAENI